MKRLGRLLTEMRTSLAEGVLGSLRIIAQDSGGVGVVKGGGFSARFDSEADEDAFLATVRMEYPGLRVQRRKLGGGRTELTITARDIQSYS